MRLGLAFTLALSLGGLGCHKTEEPKPGQGGQSGKTADSEQAKTLAAALGAAAGAKGATPCEQSYNGIEAMMKAMAERASQNAANVQNAEAMHAPPKLPERDQYLAGCRELPPPVQQCLVLAYALGHAKECQEARAHMSPEVAAKAKALMRR